MSDDFLYRFRINKIRADVYRRIPVPLRCSRFIQTLAEVGSRSLEKFARAEATRLIGGGSLDHPEKKYGSILIHEDPTGFYTSEEAVESFLPHWEYTRSHLEEVVEGAREAGVAVSLFHIPAPQSAIHGDCCHNLYPNPPELPDGAHGAFQAWVAEYAAARNVPFVQLAPTFQRLAREGDTEPVFLIPNGHLNARGNRIAGELLQGVLEDWTL